MADAYIGEIRIFAGRYAPRDWSFCDGSLLNISQNEALYSIIGTLYGGDGVTTFALPNLTGRAPIGQGAGPGLTPRTVGDAVGTEAVTLLPGHMPAHQHEARGYDHEGNLRAPTGHVWGEQEAARGGVQDPSYAKTHDVTMKPDALATAGGSEPHNNMQPYMAMTYIICLYGITPPRP